MESTETVTEERTTPDTAPDFNVHEVEQRLRSLKRDLEEYTDSDLEGVMMACLSVWQDLKFGEMSTLGTTLSTDHRLLGSLQTADSRDDRICPIKTETPIEFDRNPREVKRKRPSKGSKGQKQGKGNSHSDDRRGSLVKQPDRKAEDSQVNKAHMDDVLGKANGTYKRTVSLKEVISTFDSWKQKQSDSTTSYVPSLPPMPEDTRPQMPQSQTMEMMLTQCPSDREMDIDCLTNKADIHDWSAVKREPAPDDRPALEVYVMPSGYIVQSARMVLQQKQAAAPSTDRLQLSPLFQSRDDIINPSGQTYIPVGAPIDAATPIIWLHVDVKLTVSLMPPRKETFDDRHIPEGIDATSFLSRMEMQETPLYPLPSETIRPTTQILDQVIRDVLDVTGEAKSIKNGFRSPEGSKTSTASPLPCDIEALLQRFDERMEKL